MKTTRLGSITARSCLVAGCMALGFIVAVSLRTRHVETSGSACGLAVSDAPDDQMVFIPAGLLHMGAGALRPEEKPTVDVRVDGFWMSRHDVTVAQFTRFIRETGYRTVAERSSAATEGSEAGTTQNLRGGAVFQMPASQSAVLVGSWEIVSSASWRHPEGEHSDVEARQRHPVVQVAFEDAEAYANWAGLALPTEAQWEYAARGGSNTQTYPWGVELTPGGVQMANTWQGAFPLYDTKLDGFSGTSPVGCFPPNGYGLYDMVGNVWQWTRDWYFASHDVAKFVLRSRHDSEGSNENKSFDPENPDVPSRVIKGGSFLCAPNFCARARPAARQPHDAALGTNHLGFRIVRNAINGDPLNDGTSHLPNSSTR